MKKQILKIITGFLILFSILVISCDKSSKNDGSEDSGGSEDTNNSNDSNNNGSGSNGNDTDSRNNNNNGSGADFEVCAEITNELSKIETRAMILLDRSGSMRNANKWNQSLEAIEYMLNNYESDLAFGLDMFPVGNVQRGCNVGDLVVVDVALNNAGEINTTLGNTEIGSSTPLYLAIANYLDPEYAPIFSNNEGNSYLVVVSDGADTCGLNGVFDTSNGATNDELSQITAQLLQDRGIRTIVIGFGNEADPAQLNAMAAVGGSTFTTYIDAANGDALTSALVDIAQTVVTNCEFRVGTFDDGDNVDLSLVNVLFDGTSIPRDDNCAAQHGWTWLDDDRTVIGFCEASCEALEAGTVEEINVLVACNEDDVDIIIIQ